MRGRNSQFKNKKSVFRRKRRKKRRSLLRSLLGHMFTLALGGYLVFSLIYNQVQISAKLQELDTVKAQLVVQRAENEELFRQLEAGDLAIIEQVARDELGYARPNERVFVDMSGK